MPPPEPSDIGLISIYALVAVGAVRRFSWKRLGTTNQPLVETDPFGQTAKANANANANTRVFLAL